MAPVRTTKRHVELRRLKIALRDNEKLMQEAAINYEKLVAIKEDLVAAIRTCKDLQLKKTLVNSR
jgi:chromosome condensin MukBEF complex kleisin-like MukF subunit